MALKIVRNDITKMNVEAIVNTANRYPMVGVGCDTAVYNAAGYEELLAYRKEQIGSVEEGEVFLTPGFRLTARYIIHAVSPLFVGGTKGEEEKLRSCYRKSLQLAKENGIRSIAFPLIATGSFGYPKEEGMRIAVDEINAFLLGTDMEVYLVVFGDGENALGRKIYPDLEEYIDRTYVEEKVREEYFGNNAGPGDRRYGARLVSGAGITGNALTEKADSLLGTLFKRNKKEASAGREKSAPAVPVNADLLGAAKEPASMAAAMPEADQESDLPVGSSLEAAKEAMTMDACLAEAVEEAATDASISEADEVCEDFADAHEDKLNERIRHLSDTFSQYLLYLIQEKHMENAEVYKRAIVDKKIFSKIKNNPDYHPQKLTALCLCVGAKLNLDQSKHLLARAGYALSPCDKTDIIFSYFIENEIYDMIELDIQLEEHGLSCIIS